jgi:broad specificity phosphatase PhoE
MKLIITRHGETEENLKKIWQGHLPGKLTEKGIEQAKRLANRLKDENINVIISSDLARASNTAKEIAKFHLEIPIYFVENLRERFLGELQGRKRTNELEKILFDEELSKQKKVESMCDVELRAKKIIEGLLKNISGKTILLVGHGGLNSMIVACLLEESWEEIFNKNSPNSSVTIFEFDENKKPKLVLMNCAKHLEGME